MENRTAAEKRSPCLTYALLGALSLTSGIVGVIIGGALIWFFVARPLADQAAPTPSATVTPLTLPPLSQPTTAASDPVRTAPARVAREVGPSVVTVVSQLPSEVGFFGTFQPPPARGSGVIIDPRGYIITNHHVIEGARQLYVILADGRQRPARLVGSDYPFSDLALVKIEGDGYPAARLGDSDAVQPGEWVIAIGSALGDLRNSVTIGVVSGLGRSLQTRDVVLDDLIQTDATINRGNSGGPLVNLDGEVIGINTAIIRGGAEQAEGIGFAIPSNTVRYVADQLITRGRVARPYLPIEFVPITPRLAAWYNLPVDYGLFIQAVGRGSALERAGVRAGDILLSLGGQRIDEEHPLLRILARHQVGEEVEIEIWRDNGVQTLRVTLEELPR
ncbi:MAG: trypsin-like peptidase domain-containing protein [Roseiflexaceae bacterium]|nr:trypsin-like peptidase domain-containing protein [Roseiflexus sp.]MDW8214190.1 trypsin-like peptidase domain-containing protein [Roseiflexaceae bacterium]